MDKVAGIGRMLVCPFLLRYIWSGATAWDINTSKRICLVVRAKCIWLGFRTVQSFTEVFFVHFPHQGSHETRRWRRWNNTQEKSVYSWYVQAFWENIKNRRGSVLMVCNFGVNFPKKILCAGGQNFKGFKKLIFGEVWTFWSTLYGIENCWFDEYEKAIDSKWYQGLRPTKGCRASSRRTTEVPKVREESENSEKPWGLWNSGELENARERAAACQALKGSLNNQEKMWRLESHRKQRKALGSCERPRKWWRAQGNVVKIERAWDLTEGAEETLKLKQKVTWRLMEAIGGQK